MPKAAVALIEYCAEESEFLLLQRAIHPDDPWSGHLSFPGGRKEEDDQDLLATCIRETAESVGARVRRHDARPRVRLQRQLVPRARRDRGHKARELRPAGGVLG